MIIRFVRLHIQQEKATEFLANFERNKEAIRAFEGCNHLELWKDLHSTSYTTYSHWDSEECLNNYRHSELFKGIWSKTKLLFNDKPIAWSYEQIH